MCQLLFIIGLPFVDLRTKFIENSFRFSWRWIFSTHNNHVNWNKFFELLRSLFLWIEQEIHRISGAKTKTTFDFQRKCLIFSSLLFLYRMIWMVSIWIGRIQQMSHKNFSMPYKVHSARIKAFYKNKVNKRRCVGYVSCVGWLRRKQTSTKFVCVFVFISHHRIKYSKTKRMTPLSSCFSFSGNKMYWLTQE